MSGLSNEQILSNIYYDLERGYGSAKSLYEQAKEEGAVITLEEVKNFMKKQPNKQIKGLSELQQLFSTICQGRISNRHYGYEQV